MSNHSGLLLIVSGPSGVGKGTICNALLEKYPQDYALSVSATSRKPRGEEKDGREYFFHTREEFEKMIEDGMLLEYANYTGNYYGTPRQWVEERMQEGISVILEIEYQGGFQIKSKLPETLMIFIMPPNVEELISRLKNRGTETQEQILRRLEKAEEEMAVAERYDYIIVNEDVEKSVEMLHNIVSYEKKKITGEL